MSFFNFNGFKGTSIANDIQHVLERKD